MEPSRWLLDGNRGARAMMIPPLHLPWRRPVSLPNRRVIYPWMMTVPPLVKQVLWVLRIRLM